MIRVRCASASCANVFEAGPTTGIPLHIQAAIIERHGWRVTSSADEELEALCPRCRH